VIDANRYPVPQIEEMTRKTRKIGLGVMGWADLLFQLRIPYDSDEALQLGERMMAFISERADEASEALAERGEFLPGARASTRVWQPSAQLDATTVAPTHALIIVDARWHRAGVTAFTPTPTRSVRRRSCS
jgi:ribonucleoside-diphosphate reductase alpha chain